MALIDRVAKEDSKSDDKYIQKVKMNAYPDRVRAFFIYGKMSKKHHTIPFAYTTFYDIITLCW